MYNDFFEKYEIIPIPVDINNDVDPRLSGHTDLSVFHAGYDQFVFARSIAGSLIRALSNNNLTVSASESGFQKNQYPYDCNLNICYTDDYLIYNPKTADENIVKLLTNRTDKQFRTIKVNQGYSKCSVCVVDSNSIITGDSGIADQCIKNGMNVLLINNDWIVLNGFNHGFIGGCSFKLSKDKIAFTGLISNPQLRKIHKIQ